jgi:hypothetical protein
MAVILDTKNHLRLKATVFGENGYGSIFMVEMGMGKSAPLGPFRRASLYQCIWDFKTLLYNQVCSEKSLFQVFKYEVALVLKAIWLNGIMFWDLMLKWYKNAYYLPVHNKSYKRVS